MKTSTMRNWGLALTLASLPILVGNAGDEDDANPAAAPIAAAVDSQPAPLPATTPPAVSQPAPPPVSLSSGAAEIVKLAQAGLGDDVMLAYVGNVKSKFNLGSDQIVYLNDLGVSGNVVKTMIQHDAAIDTAAQNYATSQLPPVIPPPPTNVYPPLPTDDGSQLTALPPDNSINPPDNTVDYPVSDDSDYFYNSLAPYGNWIYVAGYGLCWQPTVCVLDHNWRPYGDRVASGRRPG
jgi:hypothetical protein